MKGWQAGLIAVGLLSTLGLAQPPETAELKVWRAAVDAPETPTRPAALEETVWQRVPSGQPLLLPAGNHWLRVQVPASALDGQHVLVLPRLPMRLSLWLPDAARPASNFREESRNALRPDPFRYAPQAYGFDLPRFDADVRLYLHATTLERAPIQIGISSMPDYYRGAGRWSGIIGAALSALAVMGLMNALFWLRLRDHLYLFFAQFIVLQMTWGAYVSGLAPDWLAALISLVAEGNPGRALLLASLAALLLFVRGFVSGQRLPDLAERGLLAAIVLATGLALIQLLPGAGGSLILSAITVSALLLLPAALLWTTWLHLRAGSSKSWPLLAGLLPLALTLWAQSGFLMGLLPASVTTLVGPLLASAFLAVIMAVALAGRVLELRVQRDMALRMAETDAMTGLLNRRGGQAQLLGLFGRCRERGLPLSVLFIDLDELKPINDQFGHEAGDACLLALANLLTEHLPSDGALSRWGGDEFVMLLPGFDSRAGLRLAEDIARHWAMTPVRYGREVMRLTASLGLASQDRSDADPQSLLLRADAAVYRAKYAGRNRVETAEAAAVSEDFTQAAGARAQAAGR